MSEEGPGRDHDPDRQPDSAPNSAADRDSDPEQSDVDAAPRDHRGEASNRTDGGSDQTDGGSDRTNGESESTVVDRVKAALGGNSVYALTNGVTILLLTRELLSPSEFGSLYFAISVLGSISSFAVLGLPKSAARYVNEYSETDPTQIRHILKRSTLVAGTLLAVVGAALTLAHEPLARLLDEPTVAPFLALGATYVVTRALHSYVRALLQGFNRIKWSTGVNALAGVSRLVFVVVFVVAGLGAVGALLGYAAGFALSVVVGGVLLYRYHYDPSDAAGRMESGLTERIIRYSLPLTLTKGAGVLDKRVDIILVGYFLNPVAVSYYVVAKQIAAVTGMPAGSFGYTVSPAYGKRKASGDADRAARLYEQAMRYTLLFYVPASVGLILVSGPAVRLIFGSDYAGAVPVVQVMSGFVLVNAVNKISSDGLDYLGRARERATMKTGTAVGNFLLNLALIPTIGVVGAAVATVVTYAAYTLGNVYYIHAELDISTLGIVKDGVVVTLVAIGMGMAVVVAVPYISDLATLAAVVLLGLVVWAGLSLLSGLVNREQLSALL